VGGTWITPKAVKGAPSGISGRGLVAMEPIARGEVVAVKSGHVVTTEQLRSLPERLQNSDVQIADDLHLVAVTDEEYEPVMLFINHSCEPNVGFGGNVVLAAAGPAGALPRLVLLVPATQDQRDPVIDRSQSRLPHRPCHGGLFA
jgi:uncharacterized protein